MSAFRGLAAPLGRRECLAVMLGGFAALTGCQKDSPPAAPPLRYLALGDSYTIGEGVASADRWPELLAAELRKGGVAVGAPQIVARTGWTTEELQSAVDAAGLAGPYDLVTLLVGVNNQFRGGTAEAYREPFRKLLGDAIRFAGGKAQSVIVVSIPDWGATPFAAGKDGAGIARAIDAFNTVNKQEASKAGARYVGVTALSREAPQKPDWLAADGLHPSGAMYRAWVERLKPEAVAALMPAP